MSILVLGAGGQLGRTFHQILTQRNAIAAFADRSAIDLQYDHNILNGLNNAAPTVVINCAAYTAVDRAEDELELAYRINAAAVRTIADWCAINDAVMIHYSTDYVFDGAKSAPYEEADNPNPESVYGKSKLAGELAFQDAGCRGICFRTSWVHSDFGDNFLSSMRRLFAEQEEVRVVDDQFGVPTTTRFIVENSLALLRSNIGKKHPAVPLHLVPSGSTSWHGFAEYIHTKMAEAGTDMKCKAVTPISTLDFPQKARRPQNSILDNSRLGALLQRKIPSWASIHNQLYDLV